MIGDRLLITSQATKNANTISQHLNTEKIILIYGCSGTQKSETADCLQELLFQKKKQSLVLSLDDFYNTLPSLRNLNRQKIGIDSVGLSEIDWDYLQRVCEDFNNNKPIHIRRTHKYADIIEHVVLETNEIDYLIIEGLYSGYLKKDHYGDFVVYLDGNPTQTLGFRKKRGKENEDDEFRQKVVQKEFNVVCQLKRYAHLIIPYEEKNET